jgi:tetratricopeptide (TPR) repeat protein
MKVCCLTILVSLFWFSTQAQCDCEKKDQQNGMFYTVCKPFLSATEAIGNIELGISGLGIDRYMHVTVSFTGHPMLFNSGLTLNTTNDEAIMLVMVQRNLKPTDTMSTGYGLFFAERPDLDRIQKVRINSISFMLEDGINRTVKVNYLKDSLHKDVICIDAQARDDYRAMASGAVQKQAYANALEFIDKAIAVDSTYPGSYEMKGFCLTRLNRYAEALELFDRLIKADPMNSNTYDLRADIFTLTGRSTEAMADYAKAIGLAKTSDDKARYLNDRSLLKSRMGDINGQVEDLSMALKLKPDYPAALNSIGMAMYDQGKYREGLKYLLNGIELEPHNVSFSINIGFTYQKLEQHDTAIQYFNMAIVTSPKTPEAYSNKSYSEYQLGKLDDALGDINTSLTLWNTNSYALWIRSLIYLEQGKGKEACADLKSASEYGYDKDYGNEVAELIQKHCK